MARTAAAVLLLAGMGRPATAAPELTVIPQEGTARPGKPYRIVCEVSWDGAAADYAICPAETDAVDWCAVTVREMRSFVRDGRNVVSQTVELIPEAPGEYTTPEIRIAYLHPEATPPAETAAPGTVPSDPSVPPSLRADPSDVVVRPSRLWAWVSGGLGVSFSLVGFGWWSVRRRRRPRASRTPTPMSPLEAVEDALHAARQHRLDGKFYEYYLDLEQAADVVAPDLGATLKTRAEAVGYRGVRPTDDEMDSDLRAVERAVARTKEELET